MVLYHGISPGPHWKYRSCYGSIHSSSHWSNYTYRSSCCYSTFHFLRHQRTCPYEISLPYQLLVISLDYPYLRFRTRCVQGFHSLYFGRMEMVLLSHDHHECYQWSTLFLLLSPPDLQHEIQNPEQVATI